MTEDRRKIVHLAGKMREPRKPAQPRDNGEQVERTSLAILDGRVWEQIHHNRESAFMSWNPEECRLDAATHLMRETTKILPIVGPEVDLGAVKLPDGAEPYGTAIDLLADIERHIHTWLDVSDGYRRFAAYYALLSWLYDRFNTIPYLRLLGDTGVGKSRALDVIGGLCYKAIIGSGAVTPAPIFRLIARWGGTLILDEADLRNSDEYNTVITLLNCGFERNRPVIRAQKDNPDRLQFFPTYGPKVFATRRRFQDPALEARCLTEIMSETRRTDIPPVLNRAFHDTEAALRRRLLMFRLQNWATTNAEAGEALRFDGIEPRLKQVSSAFAALLANQPDVFADYVQFIRKHQRELVEQRAGTREGQLVAALVPYAVPGAVETLEVPDTEDGLLVLNVTPGQLEKETGIAATKVGQLLKTLGLGTRQVRVSGVKQRLVVADRAKLEVLRKRYIPTDDDEVVPSAPDVPGVPGYRFEPTREVEQ